MLTAQRVLLPLLQNLLSELKWLPAGVTMFGALPVALLVKSPGVLALVSQASVAFVFFFAAVVAVLSLSPTQHNGMLHLVHTVSSLYHHFT